jgi:HEAT repeat protein
MDHRIFRLVGMILVVLGVFSATANARAGDSSAGDFTEDERLLQDVGIATDGSGLLELIRKRILTAADIERIDVLIKRLGDREFKNREQATMDLKDIGTASLPKLRLALRAKDAEVRRRAAEIIKFIQSDTMSEGLSAAVRLLQHRQPVGGLCVLIDYLPFIDDSVVEEEVLATLTRLGVHASEVDPALVAAVHSKAPAQRAAAAMVVGWAGTPEQRLTAKNLLHDYDATVRFRAAQGILAARDKIAFPTLISLLEGVPLELSQRAEEVLQRAAGNSAPSLTLGDSETDRKRCAAAWNDWSKSSLEKLDLTNCDVSLPFSLNARAKDIALRWLDSLTKRDLQSLKKISDVPFTHTMAGFFLVFDKREDLDRVTYQMSKELDQWLLDNRNPKDDKMAGMTFAAKDVMSVHQYLRSGMSGLRGADVPQLSAIPFRKVYL